MDERERKIALINELRRRKQSTPKTPEQIGEESRQANLQTTQQEMQSPVETNPLATYVNHMMRVPRLAGQIASIPFQGAKYLMPQEQKMMEDVGSALAWPGEKARQGVMSVAEPVIQNTPLIGQKSKDVLKEAVGNTASQLPYAVLGGKGIMREAGAGFGKNVGRGLGKAFKNFDREFPARSTAGSAEALTRQEDLLRASNYMPEIEKANPTRTKTGRYDTVAKQLAEEKFPEMKNRIYAEQESVIEPIKNQPVVGGGEKIAQEIRGLRNFYTKNIDKLGDAKILDEADVYSQLGDITLADARSLQRSLNAELQKFYNMTDEAQAAMQNVGKPIAALERAAEAVREQISKTLDMMGQDGNLFRQKSLDYGAASRLEAAAARKIAEHQAPVNPMISPGSTSYWPSKSGTKAFIAEKSLGKIFGDPNKLAGKAVKGMAKYGTPAQPLVPLPVPYSTRQLGQGAIPLGSENTSTMIVGNAVTPDYYGLVGRNRLLPPAGGTSKQGLPFGGEDKMNVTSGMPRGIDQIKKMITENGLRYEGIQSGNLVLFTDMNTMATFALPVDKFTKEAMLARVADFYRKRGQ